MNQGPEDNFFLKMTLTNLWELFYEYRKNSLKVALPL